jgi:hypothetical protein
VDGLDVASAAFVEVLAADIEAALGPELAGLVLYGSAVTGGFDPRVSDVDLVAVTSSRIGDADLRALLLMHDANGHRYPGWRDRVEVVYIGRADLRRFRTSRGPLVVISPGEPLHRSGARPADWLQNWFYARETGTTLRGPAAASLIPPISRAELMVAVRRYAGEVAARDRSTASGGAIAYAILTLCRAWRTVETGSMTSKAEGAAWVADRVPAWSSLIDVALRARLGLGAFDDVLSRADAESLIDALVARIEALPRAPRRHGPASP